MSLSADSSFEKESTQKDMSSDPKTFSPKFPTTRFSVFMTTEKREKNIERNRLEKDKKSSHPANHPETLSRLKKPSKHIAIFR